ncbi:hypothetical protein [Phenylobacterium deserti]|uniref:hypothetical protein n=1 Tax=Phenylobacterium deserti TaxID=1914756 RepID=UPI0014031EDA|nr:hypothetical protein [Phenylobacterium deserti]
MSLAYDFAPAFELEVRRRRTLGGRARRMLALLVWAGLFVIQPKLALEIWRERS